MKNRPLYIKKNKVKIPKQSFTSIPASQNKKAKLRSVGFSPTETLKNNLSLQSAVYALCLQLQPCPSSFPSSFAPPLFGPAHLIPPLASSTLSFKQLSPRPSAPRGVKYRRGPLWLSGGLALCGRRRTAAHGRWAGLTCGVRIPIDRPSWLFRSLNLLHICAA